MCRTGNFTRARILGLIAGFLIYLLSLFTGIFLTILHYYYCITICVCALFCWLLFMYGAITRSQTYAVLIMILFAFVCEAVFIALIAIFVHFMEKPEKGPLCKLSTAGISVAHPGGNYCSSNSNLAVVCSFSACAVVVLVCVELLRRFRSHLILLNQRVRNARAHSAVSMRTCMNNARRELDRQDPASSCFYVFDPSTNTMQPSRGSHGPPDAATSTSNRMLAPPSYLEAISESEPIEAPPDYHTAMKGTLF